MKKQKMISVIASILFLSLAVIYPFLAIKEYAGPIIYFFVFLTFPVLVFRLKLAFIPIITKSQTGLFFFALFLDILCLGVLLFYMNIEYWLSGDYHSSKLLTMVIIPLVVVLIYNLSNITASISFLLYKDDYKNMYNQMTQTGNLNYLYVIGIFFGNLIKNLFFYHLAHLIITKFPKQKKKMDNVKIDQFISGIRNQMAASGVQIKKNQEKEMRKIIQSQMAAVKLSDYNTIYFNMFAPNLDFQIMKKMNKIMESRAKKQMFKMQRSGGKGMKIIRR